MNGLTSGKWMDLLSPIEFILESWCINNTVDVHLLERKISLKNTPYSLSLAWNLNHVLYCLFFILISSCYSFHPFFSVHHGRAKSHIWQETSEKFSLSSNSTRIKHVNSEYIFRLVAQVKWRLTRKKTESPMH